jgi:allantoinase
VFGVAMALARHPDIVAAIKAADYDVVSHGWRWIHYQHMDIDMEREHLHKAVHVLTDLFGKPPTGWYTGRDSPNTRRLVVEHGGFDYDSDYYGDDLPFWTEVPCGDGSRKPHLIVPYTLDANDMRFATAQGFNTAEQFYTYLKDSFDVLYEEGEDAPKMMSIGMHCRLLGRPGASAPCSVSSIMSSSTSGCGSVRASRSPTTGAKSIRSGNSCRSRVARLSAGLAHQADLRGNNPPAKGKADPGLLLAANALAAFAGKLGAAHRVILAEGDDLGVA